MRKYNVRYICCIFILYIFFMESISKLPLFYTIAGLSPQASRVINIGDTSSMAQNVGSAESMGSCCVIQRDSGGIDSDLQRGWSPPLSWGRSGEFNSKYLATLWRTCQSQIHICPGSLIKRWLLYLMTAAALSGANKSHKIEKEECKCTKHQSHQCRHGQVT